MNEHAEKLRWLAQGSGTNITVIRDAADEIDRLCRAVNKMAAAAGPAWTPQWVFDAPWFNGGDE